MIHEFLSVHSKIVLQQLLFYTVSSGNNGSFCCYVAKNLSSSCMSSHCSYAWEETIRLSILVASRTLEFDRNFFEFFLSGEPRFAATSERHLLKSGREN